MDALFHLPFERTEYSDEVFSALGRALYVTIEFDKSCAALATVMGVKFSRTSTAKPEALDKLVSKLRARHLKHHVEAITFGCDEKTDAFEVLDAARLARNEVAHSVTLGFLNPTTGEPPADFVTRELRPLVEQIVRGYILVLLLGVFFNRDMLPTQTSVRQMERKIVAWVCSVE